MQNSIYFNFIDFNHIDCCHFVIWFSQEGQEHGGGLPSDGCESQIAVESGVLNQNTSINKKANKKWIPVRLDFRFIFKSFWLEHFFDIHILWCLLTSEIIPVDTRCGSKMS